MADPHPQRATQPQRPTQVNHQRPDPRPMRLALGFGGMAALSAVATALLAPSSTPTVTATTVTVAVPEPSVVHVTRVVHLQPGQTAPPQALVTQMPAPTPRTVIITTRQSGVARP